MAIPSKTMPQWKASDALNRRSTGRCGPHTDGKIGSPKTQGSFDTWRETPKMEESVIKSEGTNIQPVSSASASLNPHLNPFKIGEVTLISTPEARRAPIGNFRTTP